MSENDKKPSAGTGKKVDASVEKPSARLTPDNPPPKK